MSVYKRITDLDLQSGANTNYYVEVDRATDVESEKKPLPDFFKNTENETQNYYFGGGYIAKNSDTRIIVKYGFKCRNFAPSISPDNNVDMEIDAGIIADMSVLFGALGCLDTGTLESSTQYSIYIVSEITGDAEKLLCAISGNAITYPLGYVYNREIARVWIDEDGKIADIKNFYQIANTEIGKLSNFLPQKYFDGFEINKESASPSNVIMSIGAGSTKDDTGQFDLIYKTTGEYLEKNINSAWALGDGGAQFPDVVTAGGIDDETFYYVYMIGKSGSGQVDFGISLSATAPTLPTGFDVKKLIGAMYADDFSADNTHWVAWNLTEKWVDENFDSAKGLKDVSTFTFMPTFEEIFITDFFMPTFDNSGTQDHYIPAVEEIHHGRSPLTPLLFHGHLIPENTGTGNVVLFVSAFIRNEGDAIPAPADVVTKTVTVAMDGTCKDFELPIFYPADFGVAEFAEETQINYNIGRQSTSGSDTYASKVAFQTVGFHYIQRKRGSDLIETNL